jgi:hypothetical protein
MNVYWSGHFCPYRCHVPYHIYFDYVLYGFYKKYCFSAITDLALPGIF